MAEPLTAAPRASLSTLDAAAMLVGIVMGIGIFKTPSLVANFVPSETYFIGVWALGGFVTFVGALCYAELGSSRPSAGGEYQFLKEAYGPKVSVLFAWARCSVIQPGAIAAVAFVLGDYANVLFNLGQYGRRSSRDRRADRHRHQLRRHLSRQDDTACAVVADGRGSADCCGRRLHGANAIRAAGAAARPGLGHGGPVHGVRAVDLWRLERSGLPLGRIEGRET